jgi:hypothetical protein
VTVTPDALALLDRLERAEASLLVWGVTDGVLTQRDIDESIRDLTDGDQASAHALLAELLDSQLLLRTRIEGSEVFRSRMAETVRLAATLRQLFESNAVSTKWRTAPRLVGDFRFSVRPRCYPNRNLTVDDVVARVDPNLLTPPIVEQALRKLLATTGGNASTHAAFQADAAARILEALTGSRSTGTVITAGTGSGKTIAFYAPTFAWITEQIDRVGGPWTKVVAIYPRNELLKDQFAQAFAAARALDDLLPTGRRITVGAYFGLVPHEMSVRSVTYAGWRQLGAGFLCPYMRCPACGEDSLVWREGKEYLVCHRDSCGASVSSEDLPLSRAAVSKRPPDVLFTTTEMLNRGLCNSWTTPIFGVGKAVRAPRAILLDEIHTYGGLHGASVGLLLRRYRNALHVPVQLIGLSATLRDAQAFFATLTGLPTPSVALITPASDELVEEGAEYLLALRADPTSGASVLSTTIQTAMLTRRMLDPWDERRTDGAVGRRVFLFTDKLDIANRLFFDLKDAEGQDDRGRPAPWRRQGSLANLRSTEFAREQGDTGARATGGQLWEATEEIGFRLEGSPFVIDRTTSQDAGVDPRADVVVATASLDVGFNDPEVGAVIQHKAPRRNSQFLQRRGRAGRSRKMRPWTIVTLSDFGRDRVAYEAYDLLFDPELEPQALPVGNRHVQRMQATYSLLEWLEAGIGDRGSMWQDMVGPPRKSSGALNEERWRRLGERRAKTLRLLEQLLADDGMQRTFAAHLAEALAISPDEVERLLWDPPRALLTAVVPTAIRRLTTCWSTAAAGPATDYTLPDNPLPDFVPRSLFQSLNTPDVQLQVPAPGGGFEFEALEIDTTLREYCPGNVSQRLGVRRRRDRHWVPTADPTHGIQSEVDIRPWVLQAEDLGVYPIGAGDEQTIQVLRPLELRLDVVPRPVKSSSSGFPIWATSISPDRHSEELDLSAEGRWEAIVGPVEFFTHSAGTGVDVCRYMIGAHISRVTGTGVADGEATFVRSTDAGFERIGLGYQFDVDAVRICFPWPASDLVDPRGSGPVSRALRVGLFLEAVEAAGTLAELTSDLGRRQLGELYVTAIVCEAVSRSLDLRDAAAEIRPRLAARLAQIADQQGEVLRSDAGATSEDELTEIAQARRGLERLKGLLHDFPLVVDRLDQHAEMLWQPESAAVDRFVRRRYAATVGAAFLLAFQRMCPDADLDQVVVDLDANVAGSEPEVAGEVWLTETSAGGGGVIEEVRLEAMSSPRRLMRLVEAGLAPSDLELVDAELTRALQIALDDAEVAHALDGARAALAGRHGIRESREAVAGLHRQLGERGTLMAHPVIAAISARLLRPGASASADRALSGLRSQWEAEEERLGIEIPLRAFAFAAAASDSGAAADFVSATLGTQATGESATRYALLVSILWPRGEDVRARTLPAPNYYSHNPATDRRLLLAALPPASAPVDVTSSMWRVEADEALVRQGETLLRAPRYGTRALRQALLDFAGRPSEIGFLHLFPTLFGVSISPEAVEAALFVREFET